jgi:hypothetical protein
MEQHTTLTSTEPKSWIETLVDVVRQWDHEARPINASTITEALAQRMGSDRALAAAWMQACDVMTQYTNADFDEDEDSIDEELAAIMASRRAFRPLLEARLQSRIDRVDEATKGQATCKQCGGKASSHGRPSRTWESTLGTLKLKRRWTLCPDAEHTQGRSLAQEALMLPEGDYTALLDEAITLVATTVPHGMAVQLVGKIMGVEVSNHAVQDAVERRAERVVELQDQDAAEHRPFEDNGLERELNRPTDAVQQAPDVAYVEIDGVLPMTRELDEEKSEPAEGARGGKGLRYNLVGREVKNAVLYTGDACADESEGRGCILEKRYVSHLGYWVDFAILLWATLIRLRFDQAKLLVILSDGASWIRELAEWLPCKTFLILDLYHAMHRVWEVGRAVYGDKTPECDRWSREQCRRIEAGQVDQVLEALRFLKPTGKTATEKVEDLITYFTNNRDRMDYPSYRAQGLRITSGTVESANYHVTGARLKQQGMRWSEKGAAEMARLRADLFNGVWEKRTREVLAA